MSYTKVPAKNGGAEIIEKKSRFLSEIYKISAEEQASELIKARKKQFWDASHNVYAYILQNGVMRFSDDGEPQGTAGMPTLEVLKKEGVFDVLCITTRYFGGILLGAGGLIRAYAKAAKSALDEAGIAELVPYSELEIACPYKLIETVRYQYDFFEVSEKNADFAENVVLTLVLPDEKREKFCEKLTDVTSGKIGKKFLKNVLFEKTLKI